MTSIPRPFEVLETQAAEAFTLNREGEAFFAVSFSAAISLKRIADALEGVGGHPQRLRLLEHIAGILWSKS